MSGYSNRVDPCRFGLGSDSVEQHSLPNPTQADQHRALGVAADAGALKCDTHVFEERIAACKFDWR